MKALLVIDIQSGITRKKELHACELFIDTVNFAINNYRHSGDMIVFIQHTDNQLKRGAEDWEIDQRIDKRSDDIVMQKQHGNAFEKTRLKSILESRGIKEILVCGLVTHGCVRSTCIGGLKEGFPTRLLANGHTNWHKFAGQKITETESDLQQSGVMIIDKDSL